MEIKICDFWNQRKGRIQNAAAAALFFLILFYSTWMIFGAEYTMAASFITVLFQTKRKQKQTPKSLCALFIQQVGLSFLAFLACHDFVFCVILNIFVPFLLVFLQSSQFQQLGYFASSMGFVFLQLRPVPWDSLLPYMSSIAYGMALLLMVLLIGTYAKREDKEKLEEKGIELVSELFREGADTKNFEENRKKLFEIQKQLYIKAYHSYGMTYRITKKGKLNYFYALLFQRILYYTAEKEIQSFFGLNVKERKMIADMFEGFSEKKASFEFRKKLEEFLKKEEHDGPMVRIVSMALLIVKNEGCEEIEKTTEWRLPKHRRPFHRILSCLKLDVYEFRFAARLAIILTLTLVFNMLSGLEHAYWLALNAFLLLRPMYEDSSQRLKTRFLGTMLGCAFVSLVVPFVGSMAGHFILASLCAFFLYYFLPGTWKQAFCSTSFALIMASISLRATFAAELRMGFVVVAVFLVFIVNRFFFRTSETGIFKEDILQMFYMQHRYLRMMKRALYTQVSYGFTCDALSHFYLIYQQMEQYLGKREEKENKEFYKKMLSIFWKMQSSAEQILLFLMSKEITEENKRRLEHDIGMMDYVLQMAENMVDRKKRKEEGDIEFQPFQSKIEGEEHLSLILRAYSHNISEIYRVVLEKIRNEFKNSDSKIKNKNER